MSDSALPPKASTEIGFTDAEPRPPPVTRITSSCELDPAGMVAADTALFRHREAGNAGPGSTMCSPHAADSWRIAPR